MAGVVLERGGSLRGRMVSIWGMTLTSGVVWVLVPLALNPLRLDAPRGVAGMIGWALFALAAGAPALGRERSAHVVDDRPLRPRTPIRRGDVLYIACAIVAALGLQLIGWRILVPERALLLRLSTLACALALIGAATTVSLERHVPAKRRTNQMRVRAAVVWLVFLVLLLVSGIAMGVRE